MAFDPKQFAERLVSGMPDAIIYADAEGLIRFWNSGATRIFGPYGAFFEHPPRSVAKARCRRQTKHENIAQCEQTQHHLQPEA